MSNSSPTTDRRVINWPASDAPDFQKWDAYPAAKVRKIVLGPSPGTSDARPLELDLAKLARWLPRFTNLTHLYLWQIKGLETLPALPPKLECLDLRGCVDLTMLPALPAAMETLVLDGCTALRTLPSPVSFGLPALRDLSLKQCGYVPETSIHRILKAAPALRFFDASECAQLASITEWLLGLERIELNGCTSLQALPGEWPPQLRRAGLRGATSLELIPDFPESLDYLDLAHMQALQELPRGIGRLRTLFLYGSSVRKPPASEHGKDASENVANRTRAYFADVSQVGKGKVKRCKLLILGNGEAGKTCLSLALVPDKDPKDAERLGSTHGVQFWNWPFRAKVNKAFHDVHLHLWDFGGQEIYHNTHRLFMSKGTVFIVVWKPEQDGAQPKPTPCGYQDEWRPLQYWLDFIQLACPHGPRIAIVCSHHGQPTEALKKQLRGQLRTEFHDERNWFFVDSLHRSGELGKLEEWLRENVGQVVETQGIEVPTYWEIAQDMVQGWVRRMEEDPGFASEYNHLHPDRFREALYEAMRGAIAKDPGRYALLKTELESGRFDLMKERRIERTLAFLTHSGWVYWEKGLFQGRVIIGQKWALDGIYTVLDRRQKSFIYRELRKADGQFTQKNLHEWIWSEQYDQPEQELLISFMKAVGVCFELVLERDSWWRQAVYKSFEHLPQAKELFLQRRFDQNLDPVTRVISSPLLHKGHWQALLKDLGEHYGTDAEYASDGFYVQNKENQVVCLVVRLEKRNLGGEIIVQVAGPEAVARANTLTAQVRRFLPEIPGAAATQAAEKQHEAAAGTAPRKIQVFFSYAWDPVEQAIPTNYEEPVNAIDAALRAELVDVYRDKRSMVSGNSIVAFMQRIKETDKVIVFHSDKYWSSPFCMYEFWRLMESFLDRDAKLADVLILIEHTASGFQDARSLKSYRKNWKSLNSMPSMLEEVITLSRLKEAAIYVLTNHVPRIAGLLDRNRPWQSRTGEQPPASIKAKKKHEAEIVEWAKKLIGLRPPTPNTGPWSESGLQD